MDKLRPSLHGVALAVCDSLGCTHAVGITPVVFYAGLFVCIDIAYNVFERDVLARANIARVSGRARYRARVRSLVVLAIFATAMLIAFVAPRVGFGLICCGLVLHLRPDVPPGRMKRQ